MKISAKTMLQINLVIFFMIYSSNCASAMFTFSKDSHIYQDNKENRIYTGTRLDIGAIGDGGGHAGLLMVAYSVIDLPFSFALDTVFLPYTVTRYILSPSPPWTKQEILDWYHRWVKGNPDYHGKFYYKGSDQKFHHFAARPVDAWILIRCDKGEVEIPKTLEFEYTENLSEMKIIDPDNGFSEVLKK